MFPGAEGKATSLYHVAFSIKVETPPKHMQEIRLYAGRLYMEIAAHGFDTLRPIWELPDGLPVTDPGWRSEMLDAGFVARATQLKDEKTGDYVTSEVWSWRSPENSTLGLDVRGGRYIAAEFSVPRLLDDSPVNLRLASPDEAVEVLEYVGNLAGLQTPGASAPVLQKLARADYACDLFADSTAPGVISAGAQFKLPGTRKMNKQLHPHEGAIIRTPQQTMRTYSKGLELLHKLTPAQRKQHAATIQYAKDRGLTRMEHMNRPRKAMSLEYLEAGPRMFADRLEQGFPGGVVYIGGLHKLRAEIDRLPVSAQRKNSLLAFATRYAALGFEGMQVAYSRPTFYRQKRQFEDEGLCLDDITEFHGEVDFKPVIHQLRAA